MSDGVQIVSGIMSIIVRQFSIRGRAGRLEWWAVQLVVDGILVALLALVQLLEEDEAIEALSFAIVASFIVAVYLSFASSVRRLHDRDKSGLWIVFYFIPGIGTLWQLIECGCLEGTMSPNRYDPASAPARG